MFANLVNKIDEFMDKWGKDLDPQRKSMRSDLLELVQVAVEHGEKKDQNKITGILVKGIKTFLGKE